MRQALGKQSVKAEILKVIQELPDDCTLDDIQYQLFVRQVVKDGMEEIEAGKGIPHEEAKRRMKRWLKSRGFHKL